MGTLCKMVIVVIFGKQITKQLAYKLVGIFVVAAFVIGALVYFGLMWNEKRQFSQAEKEMDALYAQIVEKVGKPDQEKKEKSCGYASRVYDRGPRSCWVGMYGLFENIDSAKANDIMKQAGDVSGVKPKDRLARSAVLDFSSPGVSASDQEFGAGLDISSSKSCVLDFVYPLSDHSSYGFATSNTKDLLVSLHCSGDAMVEYFPVTKK